ncbi:MAG: F0F1 ATP synthase subunit delta [Eubacterium sp.]|jgi:F-type H+-transporting ATPase subunit epsilon|nr:F0F1 ATP synthase subunit delta [Eubacterium sp.]MCH4047362.1 F0F1 ATP synthase subunit delta [Eubacterium sp.]MCH4080458.1 F0F1 ATP synthase subunit delta [Eubacterium sp.]MCH4110706.1 F0F1 ATP synthase subunit delta [Eubacterium sp.]MCI1307256.1 F0F1 ATP synthase subunit delta [Eubacterium sp.]
MARKVKVEVMTPEELFYSGDVNSVTVRTISGSEGFLPGHEWCCKLLAENGSLKIREDGSKVKTADIKNGYIEVRDDIIVFCDQAEWNK